MQSEKIICPSCNGKSIIRKGKRKLKLQEIQKYKCKDCGLNFTDKKMEHRSYSAEVIYSALNNYNQGLTLEDSSREINKRFGVKTYPRLITSWLQGCKEVCPYLRIRKQTGPVEDVVYERQFWHQQSYLFRYHKVKLDKFVNEYFSPLAEYIRQIPGLCPNKLFMDGNLRCSQLRLDKSVGVDKRENFACKLAEFALKAIRSNKERHEFVGNFMLLNDTATLAVEVPVWLLPEEIPPELREVVPLDRPLTGHLDLVQARYGLIYLLDYKPGASRTNAVSQLFLYALALSIRTNIWLRNFRCAWFDEKTYFEFDPNEIVLPHIRNEYERERRKYVLDEKARSFYTSKKFHEIYEREKPGDRNFQKNLVPQVTEISGRLGDRNFQS